MWVAPYGFTYLYISSRDKKSYNVYFYKLLFLTCSVRMYVCMYVRLKSCLIDLLYTWLYPNYYLSLTCVTHTNIITYLRASMNLIWNFAYIVIIFNKYNYQRVFCWIKPLNRLHSIHRIDNDRCWAVSECRRSFENRFQFKFQFSINV